MTSIAEFFAWIWRRYNGVSLILRIVIGLILGVILGLTAPGAFWIEKFGSLFVGALKALAPILVFAIVSSALAQDASKADRRFGLVIFLYLLSTFCASVLSVLTSFAFPVSTTLVERSDPGVSTPQSLHEVFSHLIDNLVVNPIQALADANYIGILFWSILFGVAMKTVASPTTKDALRSVADAVSAMVRFVINLAPFGIMGLVFKSVGESGTAIFTEYGRLLALLVGTMLIQALVVAPLIAFVFLRRNPYPLTFTCLRESGVTAFFTRSSAANIPVNMSLCEKLGLDKDFYSLSIPLGSTINMNGAAITITVMTLAAANTLHIPVSFPAAVQDSVETALNSSSDVLFTAIAAQRS